MQQQEGIVYQAKSGFYYVWSEHQRYATKPKGLFRHTNERPLVGDRVIFEYDPYDEVSESRLIEILPRQNAFIRPSVSNVDHAMIVTSLVQPDFSYNLLDYFLVTAEQYNIKSIVILSKYDLLIDSIGEDEARERVEYIQQLYEPIGYPVKVFDNTHSTASSIGNLIGEGIYVLMGQSGVGKSSLLNQLLPNANIETNEISDSLNRGKHTTREVTLYPYNEGLLADTPGFSSIEFQNLAREDIQHLFPEIARASVDCKFRSCMHLQEPQCSVKEAVEQGEIVQSRYQNYAQIVERIDQQKKVYQRKNN